MEIEEKIFELVKRCKSSEKKADWIKDQQGFIHDAAMSFFKNQGCIGYQRLIGYVWGLSATGIINDREFLRILSELCDLKEGIKVETGKNDICGY